MKNSLEKRNKKKKKSFPPIRNKTHLKTYNKTIRSSPQTMHGPSTTNPPRPTTDLKLNLLNSLKLRENS